MTSYKTYRRRNHHVYALTGECCKLTGPKLEEAIAKGSVVSYTSYYWNRNHYVYALTGECCKLTGFELQKAMGNQSVVTYENYRKKKKTIQDIEGNFFSGPDELKLSSSLNESYFSGDDCETTQQFSVGNPFNFFSSLEPFDFARDVETLLDIETPPDKIIEDYGNIGSGLGEPDVNNKSNLKCVK